MRIVGLELGSVLSEFNSTEGADNYTVTAPAFASGLRRPCRVPLRAQLQLIRPFPAFSGLVGIFAVVSDSFGVIVASAADGDKASLLACRRPHADGTRNPFISGHSLQSLELLLRVSLHGECCSPLWIVAGC